MSSKPRTARRDRPADAAAQQPGQSAAWLKNAESARDQKARLAAARQAEGRRQRRRRIAVWTAVAAVAVAAVVAGLFAFGYGRISERRLRRTLQRLATQPQ